MALVDTRPPKILTEPTGMIMSTYYASSRSEFADGLMHIHSLLLYLSDLQKLPLSERHKSYRTQRSVLEIAMLELEAHILQCTDEQMFSA